MVSIHQYSPYTFGNNNDFLDKKQIQQYYQQFSSYYQQNDNNTVLDNSSYNNSDIVSHYLFKLGMIYYIHPKHLIGHGSSNSVYRVPITDPTSSSNTNTFYCALRVHKGVDAYFSKESMDLEHDVKCAKNMFALGVGIRIYDSFWINQHHKKQLCTIMDLYDGDLMKYLQKQQFMQPNTMGLIDIYYHIKHLISICIQNKMFLLDLTPVNIVISNKHQDVKFIDFEKKFVLKLRYSEVSKLKEQRILKAYEFVQMMFLQMFLHEYRLTDFILPMMCDELWQMSTTDIFDIKNCLYGIILDHFKHYMQFFPCFQMYRSNMLKSGYLNRSTETQCVLYLIDTLIFDMFFCGSDVLYKHLVTSKPIKRKHLDNQIDMTYTTNQ